MAQNIAARRGIAALIVLAVAAVGGLYYLGSKPNLQPTPKTPPQAVAGPAGPVGPVGPQFDVVRVDAAGNTVLAGHAAPGAVVTIKNGDAVLGTVTADANGAFVFTPATPLAPGPQQITLSETLANGSVIDGPTNAEVNVPNNPNAKSLAVLSGPNGSQVVSGQGPQPGTLGIGAVDYDAKGHAIFAGTGHPGDNVTLTMGNATIGHAVVGADGRWHITSNVPAASGTLNLADGAQQAQAPFALETLANAAANGHIVIEPGDNLWVIARHVYGHGTMYTLIYNANSQQIRDPNLIFPGQAFALPKPQG